MHVRIRMVEPDEGERLREIAMAAKGHWGYDADRVREWAAVGDFSPTSLRKKNVYVASIEDKAVGWASTIGRGDVWWLDDLWIEPEWMGKGIGRRLFDMRRSTGAERARFEWSGRPSRTPPASTRAWVVATCARASRVSGAALSPS
jgi:GNAT superfamily N-acetyltransferase